MRVINVVGARPNYMKIAPIIEEMRRNLAFEPLLLHTGQHYDYNMSNLFFEQLNMPKPDIYLNVRGGSHAEQTAKVMIDFEKVILAKKPDLVLVVGDVNSTLACALTAAKLHIPVAHVEAGLRSFDKKMPEEINRIVTDAISDYLFVTERSAIANLLKEGIPANKIFFVGNVMIDTLMKHKQKAALSPVLASLDLIKTNVINNRIETVPFALVTLHRPVNVDSKASLSNIIEILKTLQKKIRVIYPIHPRTLFNLKKFGLLSRNRSLFKERGRIGNWGINLTDPLGYLDFLKLLSEAKIVLTDSGGIQEETTILGTPCLTLRENTERPVTVLKGTNKIVGTKKERVLKEAFGILHNKRRHYCIPEKWDGAASKRIVNILLEKYKPFSSNKERL